MEPVKILRMTTNEIANKLIEKSGEMKLGKRAGIGFLVPYMLVDLAHSEFNKHIKDLPLKGEIKKLRNRWKDENAKFFVSFWGDLGGKGQDDMIDLMDEFEGHFNNLINVIRVQVMNAVSGIPFAEQRIIAAAQFCNIMYQVANIYWRSKHQSVTAIPLAKSAFLRYSGKDNPYLVRARAYSAKFSQMYYAPFRAKGVSLNDNKGLSDAVVALENRLVLWVRKNNNKEYGEDL